LIRSWETLDGTKSLSVRIQGATNRALVKCSDGQSATLSEQNHAGRAGRSPTCASSFGTGDGLLLLLEGPHLRKAVLVNDIGHRSVAAFVPVGTYRLAPSVGPDTSLLA
jgi:hypothetical protein